MRVFVLIYLAALAIGHYFWFLLGLICFVLTYGAIRLTRGIEVEVVPVRRSLVGVIACALILASWFPVSWGFRTGLIPGISEDWELSFRLTKLLIFAGIPLIVLRSKGDPLPKYVLTLKNWKRNLRVSLILGSALGILFFVGNLANKPIWVGEVGPLAVVAALPVSLLYWFFAAGFPEELFFRAFLQEHLSSLLKSRLSAIVVTSLIFGWVHIPTMIWSNPGTSVHVAFAYTTLTLTAIGFLFGVIWQRTKSLIPLAVTHTLPDAGSNLMLIIRWLKL